MSLRELFNAAKWRDQALGRLRIVIRHRGAPNDEREIFGSDIHEIAPNGLWVHPDLTDPDEPEPSEEEGVGFIPYHRVLRVSDRSGVIWERQPV